MNFMKHRKGIDLTRGGRGSPIYVGELDDVAIDIRKMIEWECIGGRCVECEREAWLDRLTYKEVAQASFSVRSPSDCDAAAAAIPKATA